MRKMFRTLLFGVIFATPMLLVPHQSKAGGLLDGLGNLIGDILGNNNNQDPSNCPPPTSGNPGNSVPLDEGTVLLVIAGLGLGVVMLYKRFTKFENSVV